MGYCGINYVHCSSRDYGRTCVTCYHFNNEEERLYKLKMNYKELLNLKNADHKGNLKFVEAYVSRLKKKNTETWLREAVWFMCEVIDLHKKTFGKSA